MEFSRLAFQNKGSSPRIASRCAVFAKTDLIHAQQEGYSLTLNTVKGFYLIKELVKVAL